jgi:UDP-N-acetylmuramate--alanine ligase
LRKVRKIHFVGIGGVGMSGIAEVLVNLGYQVSGSDLKESATVKRLRSLGAAITVGHSAQNVNEADVVVISSAIAQDNAEVVEAHAQQVPVIARAEMLAELMRLKYGIAISGTHGKTSTTSLIATLLAEGGLDPTVVIGGKLNSAGTNAILGAGEYLVAEADESDGSFLSLTPTIAVVTNIDAEHMDYFGSMDEVKRHYLQFINKVPFYGLAVMCIDHPRVQKLLPDVRRRVMTYGTSSQADLYATDIEIKRLVTSFNVLLNGELLGEIKLNMPGEHNALNSLAAIAVALELDIPFDSIRSALADFAGVSRRFTVVGEVGGVTVIDDYGHHPAEIKAVLAAARKGFDSRVIAVFQPHRFSRLQDLYEEFVTSFNDADIVLVTDVYAAGEKPIAGLNAEKLTESMREYGHRNVIAAGALENVAPKAAELARPGDIVITLGAGNVYRSGLELVELLARN